MASLLKYIGLVLPNGSTTTDYIPRRKTIRALVGQRSAAHRAVYTGGYGVEPADEARRLTRSLGLSGCMEPTSDSATLKGALQDPRLLWFVEQSHDAVGYDAGR